MNNDVAIIMPVYNEGEVVSATIENIGKHFRHIICINDGSIDNSSQKIASTKATLIEHPINLGQGAALQTGIDFALQDSSIQYFVTYDSDGQHSLDDVMHMLETIKKENVDVILGSRFLGKAENMTRLKRIVLKLAIIFSNKTSGLKLTDAHNGLRVFNRRVAEQLNITMPDFSHASEIIERIANKSFSYKEVPVTILYTDYSQKKGQSVLNAINISFDILLRRITK